MSDLARPVTYICTCRPYDFVTLLPAMMLLCGPCGRSQGVAFVLNTVDFEATIAASDRHVPRDQTAAVPNEVMRRFCEAFEPRPDVLEGRLVRG
jgi:hypothetical protein